MPQSIVQGSGEQLILDEGRVNKFNKRFASIGAFGEVAPASKGGDKKLVYKVSPITENELHAFTLCDSDEPHFPLLEAEASIVDHLGQYRG